MKMSDELTLPRILQRVNEQHAELLAKKQRVEIELHQVSKKLDECECARQLTKNLMKTPMMTLLRAEAQGQDGGEGEAQTKEREEAEEEEQKTETEEEEEDADDEGEREEDEWNDEPTTTSARSAYGKTLQFVTQHLKEIQTLFETKWNSRRQGTDVLPCTRSKKGSWIISREDKKKYNLPSGIQQVHSPIQRFIVRYRNIPFTGVLLNIPPAHVHFEDPRDCAEIIRALQKMASDSF